MIIDWRGICIIDRPYVFLIKTLRDFETPMNGHMRHPIGILRLGKSFRMQNQRSAGEVLQSPFKCVGFKTPIRLTEVFNNTNPLICWNRITYFNEYVYRL